MKYTIYALNANYLNFTLKFIFHKFQNFCRCRMGWAQRWICPI